MRQLDKVGAALANALGFSVKHTEARMKVICNGVDKNSKETIIVIECRIRKRTTPLMDTENTGNPTKKKKSGGLKSPGNPKTPHKSLMRTINQRAANQARRS